MAPAVAGFLQRAKGEREKWQEVMAEAEKDRRYRARHPEKVKERRKLYRAKHKEQERERTYKWRAANPDRDREIREREHLKARARRRGLSSIEDLVRDDQRRRAAKLQREIQKETQRRLRAARVVESDADRQRRYYWQRPAKGRARVIRWRLLNKTKKAAQNLRRRSRIANVETTLTETEWKALEAVYHYRCAYCGRRRKLTIDHLVPIARGGDHTLENVIPACRSCNSSKGARAPRSYQPLLIVTGLGHLITRHQQLCFDFGLDFSGPI